MKITSTTVANLIKNRSQLKLNEAANAAAQEEYQYSDAVGFHLYCDLQLMLKLAAPSDIKSAKKYLDVIQKYALYVEFCASQANATILEVQGERIHVFIPTTENNVSANNLKTLITFAKSLCDLAYSYLQKDAGTAWDGFKMAADHGRAVILSTGRDADDSLVSLGPCANAPAKQLSNVKAGYLNIRTEIAKKFFDDADLRCTWYEINCQTPTKSTQPMIDEGFLRTMAGAVAGFSTRMQFQAIEILAEDTGMYDGAGILSVGEARIFRGLYMRPDLDGFTSMVKQSFQSGKIVELIQTFKKVIGYGEQYIKLCPRRVVQLPWAGDCANMLLLPSSLEDYDSMHTYLPAIASCDWHKGHGGKVPQPYKDAGWLIGICGGTDAGDSGNGYVLVSPIKTSERNFLVAAGWGVCRSLDSHEVEGTKPGDTLIANEDYAALDDKYQELFRVADSRFYVSSRVKDFDKKEQAKVPNKSVNVGPVVIPNPRPYSQ